MALETQRQKKRRCDRIVAQLKVLYPDAHCALEHRSPLELLIATILSAQCTDVRVNMVTPVLFKRFPTALALANADITEIEKIIQSTGFFRAKAKSIQQAARQLVTEHVGQVPQTMEALTSLRGVGRKTANVVLGNAFAINVGVVVDTHVGRLARRMDLSRHANPEKVERDLMKLIAPADWTIISHLLIFHGRRVCGARKPDCGACSFGPAGGTGDMRTAGLCPRRGIKKVS